ncbi:MAG TPA: aminopeptidase [Phycisphaerales bacterium]|nr:aminopeptidase [Phycisphaerales bacterium]
MRDPRLDRLADVLVRYSTRVKPGDLVHINSEAVAMPLIVATYEAVLRAGGNPFWSPRSEELQEAMLTHASEEQLRFVSPLDIHRTQSIDVHIAFWAELNTKFLGRIDPKRTAMLQSARKPIMKIFMERCAASAEDRTDAYGRKGIRWCGTLFPTLAAAQDAEMSLNQYEAFVFRAGLLHLPDPVKAWEAISERQQRVVDYLTGKKELRFRAPPTDGHDGTDLRVDVSKAHWINCAGRENFPDGEVFAGPTLPADGGFGASGHANFTFPAVYQGREVEGVRLKFENGKVVDAAAKKNEEFLIRMLDQDAGARIMGEIAIGTNYSIAEFSRNTLFDEKIGGTFHMAVGAGYPESGNSNESGLHWDMVCDLRPRAACAGGSITADGEVFHKDGQFQPVVKGWAQ